MGTLRLRTLRAYEIWHDVESSASPLANADVVPEKTGFTLSESRVH